jgi:hypothetical protein
MPRRVEGRRRVARGHRVIKLLGLAAVVSVAALAPCAGRATAQAPDEDWRTLQTEHFRVTFPAHLEGLGRRAAARAEMAWAELSEVFLEPPGRRIDVLVTDHTDFSNGFAQVVPSNRVTSTPDRRSTSPGLGYFDDWLDLVITHELAHIVHLDHTGNPLGRTLRAVFGACGQRMALLPRTQHPALGDRGARDLVRVGAHRCGSGAPTGPSTRCSSAPRCSEAASRGRAASGASPLWPARESSLRLRIALLRAPARAVR